MNSLGLTTGAAVVGLILALLLGYRCLSHFGRGAPRDHSRPIGLIVAALGIAISLFIFFSRIVSTVQPAESGWTGWSPPASAGGISFKELSDAPLLGPARPWVALDLPAWNLQSAFANAEARGYWLLLDGSRGIRPEYQEWIQSHFGGTPEKIARATDGSVPMLTVCYRRTPVFPLASGRCLSRSAQLALQPSGSDLARFSDGRSAVTLRRDSKTTLVLALAEISVNASIEEGCLQALGNGSACAALETLPSATLSSLVLKSIEPRHLRVFKEFEISTGKDSDEALSIYAEGNPLDVTTAEMTGKEHVCGGMLGSDHIRVLKMSQVTASLKEARNEKEVSSALNFLDEVRDCPAIALVEIPQLQLRNEASALRSILTQIRERPLWVTTPESFKIRLDKIDRTQMTWRTQDGSLWIRPETRIENLAITVLSNRPITDNHLAMASVSNDGVALNVHRLTPSSFRLSFDELREPAGVRFGEKIWKSRAESASIFLDWTGFAGAALISFIFAALINLFQSVVLSASRSVVFYFGTFSAVFVISFVWLFLSYRAALAPTGIAISHASVERASAPLHFFFREWPDGPQVASLSGDQAGDIWSRWANYLAQARTDLKGRMVKRPGQVLVAGVSKIPRTLIPGGGRIVLWDDARARNFHFRRDAEYQAWMVGWEALFKKRHDPFSMETGGSAESALRRSPQILIIPDARFLEEADHKRLEAWVQAGGTLVVSEGPVIGAARPTAASAWLDQTGFGSSAAHSYSKVLLPGSRSVDISIPHQVVSIATVGVKSNSWYGSVAMGKGRAFFMGLAPLDFASQEVLAQWVGGLLGEQIGISESKKSCVTSLLLEPWGASAERLRAFAFSLHSRGISIQWLVDPVSFSQMMPQWQDEFRRDGVVFRDDGTRETRELAALLAGRAGWNDPTSLVFATSRSLSTFSATEPGPDGSALFRFVSFPGIDSPARALEQWKSECTYGVADPRLIDPAWVEGGATGAELSSTNGLDPDSVQPILETFRVLRSMQAAPPGTRSRVLTPDRLDPLVYSSGAAKELSR